MQMRGVGAEHMEVDPQLRQVGDFEQWFVAGQFTERCVARKHDAGERRRDGVIRQAGVALDHGQYLALGDAVAYCDIDPSDRAGEACCDACMAAFDEGQQALDVVGVADCARRSRGHDDAVFAGGVGGDLRSARSVAVLIAAFNVRICTVVSGIVGVGFLASVFFFVLMLVSLRIRVRRTR